MTPDLTPDDAFSFDDVNRNLRLDGDRALVKKTQEINSAFWDRLRETKHVQDHAPMGDFHQVASIPCLLVEKWISEGFNIFDKNVSIQDVLKRLRAEDATNLITTKRTNF